MCVVHGYCRTNLDDYKKEEWPNKFAFPPRVGDKVKAKSGITLHVVSVTHFLPQKNHIYDTEMANQPMIEVELHRRGE